MPCYNIKSFFKHNKHYVLKLKSSSIAHQNLFLIDCSFFTLLMAEEIYAPIISSEMTISDALRQVSKIARGNNTLRRGFNEVTKSIMRERAQVVLLSNETLKTLADIIIALGKQHKIPIIKIESSIELGKIVGFEKVRDNEVVKTSKCGVAAIDDFVVASEGRYYVENILRGTRGE